jgi:exopolyphosphatase/guanosine-5'-triphosphate,3'-diphosphate pyrophosphatase
MPRRSHLPYMELDRKDRLLVTKLGAILRVANALDAEHLQKVQELRLVRAERTWVLEVDGTGDITMEQLAAGARSDMFTEVFGHELIIRAAGVVA